MGWNGPGPLNLRIRVNGSFTAKGLSDIGRGATREPKGPDHGPWLAEQSREARLFEVMVAGESLCDALLSHDDERDTVSQRPALVRTFGIELHPLVKKPLSGWHDRTG